MLYDRYYYFEVETKDVKAMIKYIYDMGGDDIVSLKDREGQYSEIVFTHPCDDIVKHLNEMGYEVNIGY